MKPGATACNHTGFVPYAAFGSTFHVRILLCGRLRTARSCSWKPTDSYPWALPAPWVRSARARFRLHPVAPGCMALHAVARIQRSDGGIPRVRNPGSLTRGEMAKQLPPLHRPPRPPWPRSASCASIPHAPVVAAGARPPFCHRCRRARSRSRPTSTSTCQRAGAPLPQAALAPEGSRTKPAAS
jgi:hypothetical protein